MRDRRPLSIHRVATCLGRSDELLPEPVVGARPPGSLGTKTRNRAPSNRQTRAVPRFFGEIRDHLYDSTAAHVAAGLTPEQGTERAIQLIGAAAPLAEDWRARQTRRRNRERARIGILISATVAATALAVAHHAQGRHTPSAKPECAAAQATAATPATDCGRRK
jgi:hypothetical protein